MTHHRKLLYRKKSIILIVFFFILCTVCSCHSSNKKSSSGLPALGSKVHIFLKSDSDQTKIAKLAGNVIVILYSNTRLGSKKDTDNASHHVILDGHAFFEIPPQQDTPFIVHTGMLNLITQNAYFQVKARRKDPGQSVELLRGKLIAEKAYPSDYPDTEILHAGDMVMINKDIDLMEKETFDTTALSSRFTKGKQAR